MRYFKIGDRVLSKTCGIGTVEQSKEDYYFHTYPIGVKFERSNFEWFTFDGRFKIGAEIDLYQLDAITFNENKPIKDEYVQYDFSDADNLIGNIIKHKDTSSLSLITNVNTKWVTSSRSGITYSQLLDNYEFQDGSMCGKIKK